MVAALKAITVHQPWCRAIALGHKPVENRGRPTRHRGPVAIHAGKQIDGDAERDPRIIDLFGRDSSIGQPLGAVVAVAVLVDCHRAAPTSPEPVCCKPWGQSLHYGSVARPAWHLVLADVHPLRSPVPVRGQQAVPWRLPPEIAEQVSAQLDHPPTPTT